MKRRKLYVCVAVIVFFTFYWFYGIPDTVTSPNATTESIFHDLNSLVYTFNSARTHCLFFTLVFLMSYKNFYLPENMTNMTRSSSRNQIFNSNFKGIIVFVGIFILIHQSVDVLFHTLYFGVNFLVEMNFYINISLSMIGFFFYYVIIGQFYSLVVDLTYNKSASLFIVYLFIVVTYFIGFQIVEAWSPIKDLALLSSLPVQAIEIPRLFSIYAGEIGTIVILFLIGRYIFVRKDVFE